MTLAHLPPASSQRAPFADWVILELRGRRRLAGYLSEQHIAGASFLRLDIPGSEGETVPLATQYYSPSSIAVITPTTEETARTVADGIRHVSVPQWDGAG
jgi:hypothetical protein